LETSTYEGTSSLIRDSLYTNEFTNLFPSAFVSYKIQKNQQIYLSYTRRTNRPSFYQMMPYVDISNPMDTSAGNPNLIPEFIHNSELNYSRQLGKGHNIMGSAYYQYTENLMDRIRTFYADGRSFSRPQNLSKGITYGLEITGKFQLNPNWDATMNFNYFRNEIHSALDPSLNNIGTSFFTKLNSSLKLPNNFSLQLSGTYEAPKVVAQGRVKEIHWLDLGLRKNLLNNQANLVINISDIFNARKTTNLYDFPNASQIIYRDKETRILNLTFTYRFGKTEFKTHTKPGRDAKGQVRDRDKLKQSDGDGGF
jgi:iron complex outermembrane recepter protein